MVNKKSIIAIVFLLVFLVAFSKAVTSDTPNETDISDITLETTSITPDINKSKTGGACDVYEPTVEPIIVTDPSYYSKP